MGNKEQGWARTGGGAEEEWVGGRGHLLPEEGEPQNHLEERTAQDRARPTGGAATAAQEGEGLQREYVTTQHKPVVFEVRMKKWKEKRTMGPKNIKWWKCKDEMMAEYWERVRRKYEELDSEKGTVEGERRLYKDAFVGVAEELCGRTSGKGGTPEAETKDGGRKRWRRQWGRSGKHGR